MDVTPPKIAVSNGGERDASGRFAPGNSGKPPGSRNLVSRNALIAVQNLASLAVLKLRERIELGDMSAIKLCLEYTLPRDGRTVDIGSTDALAVMDACAHGDISPMEADRISSAFNKLATIAEIKDLIARLDELEVRK